MYPPPQNTTPQEGRITQQDPFYQHQTGSVKSHTKSFSQSHPAPFAYEYVIEDGKMPFLAELHPMKAREFKRTQALETYAHNNHTIQRQGSLKRKDRQLTFDMPLPKPHIDTIEKTKDTLKRAFSLSGLKSSTQSKYFPSTQEKQSSTPVRNDSTRSAPPNICPPMPTLILPTPTSTPELEQRWDAFRNSIHSDSSKAQSSTYRSVNFSLPRSSWASSTDEEDQMDLLFVRETAQGRFTPNPQPQYGMRRNKALQILGISEMPLTPPYTPLHSAAPSIYDHSRMNSRRASMEQRISQHSAEKDKTPYYAPWSYLPTTPEQSKPSTPESDKTPRAPQISYPVEQQTPRPPQVPVLPQVSHVSHVAQAIPMEEPPRPSLKRKTSRFTEHLETPTKKENPHERKGSETSYAPPIPPKIPLTPLLLFPQPRRSENSFELLTPQLIQLPPSPDLERSESMRTPSPTRWGNVVCTAEARPIVAMGTAKLISS